MEYKKELADALKGDCLQYFTNTCAYVGGVAVEEVITPLTFAGYTDGQVTGEFVNFVCPRRICNGALQAKLSDELPLEHTGQMPCRQKIARHDYTID